MNRRGIRSEIIKVNDNNDRIYYNIEVTNPLINPPGFSVVNGINATFTENRVQPIVDNPSDYYLTIARFELSGSAIPILIFPIQTGLSQTDPNLSPLSVTLTYLGVDYQAFVEYVPQSPTVPVPLPPSQNNGLQVTNTTYYYIFNYQYFLDLVNTAFQSAFTALNIAHAGVVPSAPYFLYDPVTELVRLIVPNQYINTVQIWINNPLYTYFFGLPTLNFVLNNLLNLNGKDQQVIVKNYTDNCFTQCGTGATGFVQMSEEWVSLQYWNSFKNIVFVSPSIGVVNEYIPTSPNANTGGTISFLPILTDFQPILNNPGDSRSQISFFPQGPYRLINLTSSTPLVHVDLTAYWQDINDNLHPIILLPNTFMSVKFLFIKKSSYIAEL